MNIRLTPLAAAALIAGIFLVSPAAHAQYGGDDETPPGLGMALQERGQLMQGQEYLSNQARMRARFLGDRLVMRGALFAKESRALDQRERGFRNELSFGSALPCGLASSNA